MLHAADSIKTRLLNDAKIPLDTADLGLSALNAKNLWISFHLLEISWIILFDCNQRICSIKRVSMFHDVCVCRLMFENISSGLFVKIAAIKIVDFFYNSDTHSIMYAKANWISKFQTSNLKSKYTSEEISSG